MIAAGDIPTICTPTLTQVRYCELLGCELGAGSCECSLDDLDTRRKTSCVLWFAPGEILIGYLAWVSIHMFQQHFGFGGSLFSLAPPSVGFFFFLGTPSVGT